MKKNFATGVLLGLFFLTGCSSFYEAARCDTPQLTSFLPHHELLVKQSAQFPFHYFWVKRNGNWDKYDKIYVAPINMSYMLKDSWWDNVDKEKFLNMQKDIPKLAEYMRGKFIEDLKKVAVQGKFTVVEKPEGAGTATIELALTQLIPTKAELNYLGTAAGVLLPVPGVSMAASIAATGTVSVECKITNAATGELLAMYADREKDPAAVINIASYTWYSTAQNNIDIWARQTAAMVICNRIEDLQRDFPLRMISY